MTLASLERAILAELKSVTGNQKLTKNSIMAWNIGPLEVEKDGEILVRLADLGVNVVYVEKKK